MYLGSTSRCSSWRWRWVNTFFIILEARKKFVLEITCIVEILINFVHCYNSLRPIFWVPLFFFQTVIFMLDFLIFILKNYQEDYHLEIVVINIKDSVITVSRLCLNIIIRKMLLHIRTEKQFYEIYVYYYKC